MKVNFDLRNTKINHKEISFEGYKPVKNNDGNLVYEFNYPYDANLYDCYLEICTLGKDKKNNYYVQKGLKNLESPDGFYKLNPDGNKIDLSSTFGVRADQDFAYHYVLVQKGVDRRSNDAKPVYKIDAGDYIDSTRTSGAHEIYNVVTANGSKTVKTGAMKLLIPDFYNPLWAYDKDGKIIKNSKIKDIRNMTKTFANKVGGSLAGIEKDVIDGKFNGYERIISTPIFTDDSLSGHGYWNKNCMQMVHELGNINNYASLQREMFKKGINFVSDGAFVNEGLEGIHFKHVLKWGEDSPYFNWFKAHNLKNGPLTLGVFPKNNNFVSHKLVNAPFVCIQDPKTGKITTKSNSHYTDKQPTYIQIFDNRLVSEATKKDPQKLIRSYDKPDTGNPVDINTHNDTLVPYSFEIDPQVYLKNIARLNEFNSNNKNNKITLDSYMGTRFVSKFENFELEEKFESKFETWDANTDIPKLNFVYSNADTAYVTLNFENDKQEDKIKFLERKNYEVQDYVITAGKYWTGKTSDILNLYVAQQLKGVKPQNPNLVYAKILENINTEKFPEKLKKEINFEVVQNVLNDDYRMPETKSTLEYKDLVLAGIMNLPLDSIEFGDNLTTVLASPYITKRATSKETLGTSRYQMYKNGNPHLPDEYKNTYKKMDSIYANELHNYTTEILANLNEMVPTLYDGYNTTTYGKYVLPMITEIIAKHAIVTALAPKTKFTIDKTSGEIAYDYDELKNVSLETLGINASSPEDEAKQVLNKIQQGLKKLTKEDKTALIEALYTMLKGTNEHSFRLAEVINDRINAGLDWRIDATKDIANMDGLRDKGENLDKTWTKVTNFWKAFSKGVYSQNPNAYIVAEITDEDDLFQNYQNSSAKYNSGGEMVKKFLRETGMTATANYSYYFSSILNLFGKHFDNNDRYDTQGGFNEGASHRMYDKSNSFFELMPFKSILGSYNFVGNHDKARVLHGLIVNTDWYNQDLSDPNNFEYREKAYRILSGNFLDPTIPCESEEFAKRDEYKNQVKLFIKTVDFSNANTKALAMAESLQKGFEKAISSEYPYAKFKNANETISGAIYKSIGELANGKYLGKNFSSEGFGVKPIETAVKLVLNQAIKEHGLNLNNKELQTLQDNTIRAILEPALGKLVAMTEVLSVMPGMPTLYAGDDLGATGYESTTKNIYVQNRSYIRREWAAPKNEAFDFIRKHYLKMNKIMTTRSNPNLHALNDGAPFLLPIQKGVASNNQPIDMSAILRQGSDGSVVVSLINTAGIDTQFDHNYNPLQVKLDRIEVSDLNEYNPRKLTKGLTQGIILYNANNENETYMVKELYGKNFIKRVNLNPDGTIREELPTYVNGTTLTLYSKPKKQYVSTPVYNNIGPKKYDRPTAPKVGEKLLYAGA
ncbi:hypothetical protein IKU74_01605 [bacterium]|nr:hypothetical protein [bacterium]